MGIFNRMAKGIQTLVTVEADPHDDATKAEHAKDAAAKRGTTETSGVRERPTRRMGELQELQTAEAFEEEGFQDGMRVFATMEKKQSRGADQRNDDNILLDRKTGLMGVFDGVGSTEGHFSSRLCEGFFPDAFIKAQAELRDVPREEIAKALVKGRVDRLERIHGKRGVSGDARKDAWDAAENILNRDEELARKAVALLRSYPKVEESIKDMKQKHLEHKGRSIDSSTTACVGFVHTSPDGSRWAVVSNAGDSGAGVQHEDGSFEMITDEDSMLADLREAGVINDETLAGMRQLKQQKFPVVMNGKRMSLSYYDIKATVTSTVGDGRSEPTLRITRLRPGDEIVYGTDGLWDKFEDKQDNVDLDAISKTLSSSKDPIKGLDALREEAMLRKTESKYQDDTAIVVAKIE